MAEKRPGLLVVQIDIPHAYERDLARWYDEAHLPERRPGPGSARGVKPWPGFRAARRFRALGGAAPFMALYELDEPGAALSEAYMTQQPPDPEGARLRDVWHLVVRNVYAELTPGAGAGLAAPPGRALLLAMAEIAPECVGDYLAWYAALPAPADRRPARRFEAVSGAPAHLVLFEAGELDELPAAEDVAAALARWSAAGAPAPEVRAFREGDPASATGW